MINVSLQQLPSQELTIPLEGKRYIIRIIETNSAMAISITRDDVVLVDNERLIANGLLLRPYLLTADDGNFMLYSQDDSLPSPAAFGITQFLIYYTSDELETLIG